ncbi:MAG: type II toxin-antitoxin system RelE/ParE family toxin [Muribaculaceae bacterium]|nr:type II toxin-antitoxin system RelE/ParE family toxin [Muribaculaceae bacterium]
MEVYFRETYLKELYVSGKDDKKHRFQPAVIRKYIDVINLMTEVPSVISLMKYKSLHYEKLSGDKKGLSSVRINNKYRIEFQEYVEDGEVYASICEITELSNHYQ